VSGPSFFNRPAKFSELAEEIEIPGKSPVAVRAAV
jgi:hypothetical protein